MLTLIVELNQRRHQFVFSGDEVTIGRHEENDLRIGSRFVSLNHCKLQQVSKGWKVVDLKSQNGTRVNGMEVTQKILRKSDRLEVGHVPIWFETAPEEVTDSLDPATDELTPSPLEDVVVSARTDGGSRGALAEEMSGLLLDYRKAFGDERGLFEVERAMESVSANVFPRPAFSLSTSAAKLAEVTSAINSEVNLKRCLDLIIDSVVSITNAERGFLILMEGPGRLKVKVARNFDSESVTKADMKFSRSIAKDVEKTGNPIISTSAQDDERFESFQSVESLKLRSVLCLPLKIRERVTGVLYLDHRFQKGVFNSRDLQFVSSFTDQAAIAIENARLYEENSRTQDELAQRKTEIDDLNSILKAKLEEKEIDLSDVRSYSPRKEDFRYDYSFIIGNSPKMLAIFQLLEKVIPSGANVLVTGESGTGKELIAKAIHENGDRAGSAFVKENCAAIPETLLESELFGYKKGAFTGADRDKKGLLQQADKGTLFLDEIGEMSPDMQKKLLRVLQESEIRPVGSNETIKIDVRLVSASNRNLRKLTADSEFREDLFYRLNVIGIEVPPLRERIEDIPLLVGHFLEAHSERDGSRRKVIDEIAMRRLLQHHWPGNVRELENEIQRACAIGGDTITADDFSADIGAGRATTEPAEGTQTWKDIVRMTAHQKERELILQALEDAGWKKSAAAKSLGISRPTLDSKVKALGLGAYIKRGKMSR